MKNFTVISDPGIDDLVALMLLHKLIPNVSHCLISTFGNAPEKVTAQNAKEFISFVSPMWQFKHGSSSPLNNQLEHPWPDYFHGSDGVWGIHPVATTKGIKALSSYPKYSQAISLAPLTDVLRLIKNKNLKKIAIMGGAFGVKGNETEYAETNIAFDPDSAEIFFKSCLKVKIQVIPLDVTKKVSWSIGQIRAIPETNGANIWLKKVLLAWFKNYDHKREKNFNLHDPLAVYLNFFPKEAKWLTSGIRVEVKGEKRGQTSFDSTNPPCKIAIDLFNPKRISQAIYSLIFI